MLSVKDTGLGIKSDDLSKLFKEFSKVNDKQNTALNSQGIGLGLMISNKIAHQLNELNGGIKVESESGKGSIFSFKIIDKMSEEKEFLITSSIHDIDKVSEMEYKLINNLFSPFTLDESQNNKRLIRNLSLSQYNSVKTLPEIKNTNKMSGSIDNDSSQNSKKKPSSFSEKKSSKTSKNQFFFTDIEALKNPVSSNDFKSKEFYYEEKKKDINIFTEKRNLAKPPKIFYFSQKLELSQIFLLIRISNPKKN